MTGLLVPKHQAHLLGQRQQPAAAVAQNIRQSSKTMLSSDEFISPADVRQQLDQLSAHFAEDPVRRALPRPVGWRLMLLVLTMPSETAGGVVLPDDSREAVAHRSVQAVVLGTGEGVYTDPTRFAVGDTLDRWVNIGDRILLVRYDIHKFVLSNGQTLGVVNDTQPLAVIDRDWYLNAETSEAPTC